MLFILIIFCHIDYYRRKMYYYLIIIGNNSGLFHIRTDSIVEPNKSRCYTKKYFNI